jgi:hypothetical protein
METDLYGHNSNAGNDSSASRESFENTLQLWRQSCPTTTHEEARIAAGLGPTPGLSELQARHERERQYEKEEGSVTSDISERWDVSVRSRPTSGHCADSESEWAEAERRLEEEMEQEAAADEELQAFLTGGIGDLPF